MRTRSGVSAIADSSTTTRSPERRRQRWSSPWAVPRGQPFLGGEPAGDVAGVQTFAGENLGGDLGRGQADRPARLPGPQSRVLPGLGQDTDHEALAGTGRADQGLDPCAGGEDPADGGGLVSAELDTLGGQVGNERVRLGTRRLSARAGSAVAAARSRSWSRWSGVA